MDGDSFHLGENPARVFVQRILGLAVLVQPLSNVRALPDNIVIGNVLVREGRVRLCEKICIFRLSVSVQTSAGFPHDEVGGGFDGFRIEQLPAGGLPLKLQ